MRGALALAAALGLLAAAPSGSAQVSAAPSQPSQPEDAPPRAARSEVERGPARLIVEADPPSLRLSDELTLTITVDAEAGVKVTPPPFGERLGAFVIRDFHEPLPRVAGGREIREQRYVLEPTGPGQWTIPPIPVTFRDARPGGDGKDHTLESEPLVVEVTSTIEGGTPSLADVRPAAPPLPPPAPILPAPWVWGGALGLLVAAAAAVLLLRRLRREPAAPPPTPAELAARELRELLAADPVGRGEVKAFYLGLTGIVRRFIERTTGIHAPRQTTREFLRAMKEHRSFEPADREKLGAFLEAADLVKFAGLRPGSAEIEESLDRARAFVGIGGASVRAGMRGEAG